MIASRVIHAAALALTLLAADASVAARPGDLDPTFGSSGLVGATPDIAASEASVVLRQPDGKLIVVGDTDSSELALMRYNVDGTLDPTFGAGGVAVSTPIADRASAAVLQADGKILVASVSQESAMEGSNDRLLLARFLADGSIDATYGNGGKVVYPPPNGQFGQSLTTNSLLIAPDGKAIVSANSSFTTVCGGSFIALLRFTVDGSIDSSYGASGVVCTSSELGGVAAVQPDGAVVVSAVSCPDSNCIDLSLSRYDASGGIDATFGSNGTAPVTISPPPQIAGFFYTRTISAMVVQPDGKLLLGLSGASGQAIPVATRLNADGSIDQQFAGGNGAFAVIGDPKAGTAHTPSPAGGPTFAVLQSDGKPVLVSRPWDNASSALHFGLARFTADGTLDASYGDSGVVLGPPGTPVSALVQADDKLVIAGQDLLLARFLAARTTDLGVGTSANPAAPGQSVTLAATVAAASPSGTVQFRDGAFVLPGCASVPVVASADNSLATCSISSLALGTHTVVATYSGDAINPPGQSPLLIQVVDTPGADLVVEYVYPAWNHYFVTSLPSEIAALDGGAFPGWQRTGETFAAYPVGAPLSTTQCRFFSGSSFAPKSSHFYSPYPFECDLVQFSEADVWAFEGMVTPVRLADASGTCPPGARPLYRLYNNGSSGAPNHRYTTSLDIRAAMIAQGWIPEGAGTIGVIACVPGT